MQSFVKVKKKEIVFRRKKVLYCTHSALTLPTKSTQSNDTILINKRRFYVKIQFKKYNYSQKHQMTRLRSFSDVLQNKTTYSFKFDTKFVISHSLNIHNLLATPINIDNCTKIVILRYHTQRHNLHEFLVLFLVLYKTDILPQYPSEKL